VQITYPPSDLGHPVHRLPYKSSPPCLALSPLPAATLERGRARAESGSPGEGGGRGQDGAAAHLPEAAQLRHQVQPDPRRQDPW
jgi:hypothetical protein